MAKGADNKHTKLPAVILPCTCTANSLGNTSAADYQNKIHGKGKRVHNPSARGYSCTVCTDLKPLEAGAEKK